LVFALMAIFGPLVGHEDPSAVLGVPHAPPSAAHPFGTTGQGQDVLVETILGARVSLTVGVVVGAGVMAIGAIVGLVAGYFGGLVDDALSLVTNVFLILPGLPLCVVVAAYLPAGPAAIAAVLVLTGWSWNARVLRAQMLSLRQKDFVAAAIVAGEGHLRVIF